MLAGLCAAFSVFLAAPASPRVRCRAVFGPKPPTARAVPQPTVIAMALAVVGSLTIFGLPLGLVVAIFTAPAAARFVGRLESSASRRRRALLVQQLPGAVDLLVSVLDAGRPPVAAFALVARATPEPLGAELSLIAGRLAVSGDEQAIWHGLPPELGPLGRSFRRAGRSGMPVGRILVRLADELRRERRAASQERARSVAVATAAPLGVCFLPAFFLIGILPTILGTFQELPL